MNEAISIDPEQLAEGKRCLARLREHQCLQFRTYADAIIDALQRGTYRGMEDLGASEIEVYELAIKHASAAALKGSITDLAILNQFACRLQKACGAQLPPAYATPRLVVDNNKPVNDRKAA